LYSRYKSKLDRPYISLSIGILEPQHTVHYTPREFARKRNARRSFLYHSVVLSYVDKLLRRQTPTKTPLGDMSTRRQQRELYSARIVLSDYIARSRRYSEQNLSSITNSHLKFSNNLAQRARWQRQFHFYLFGGSRSRRNSIYSQQYVGNLQLIHRFFAISWHPYENNAHIWALKPTQAAITIRRKISLDQSILIEREILFEHEELGSAKTLKVKQGEERVPRFSNSSKTEMRNRSDWIVLSKKRYLQDIRVRSKPLYVGWDKQRHALANNVFSIVQSNHFYFSSLFSTNSKT
jgi:hypothetical protein